MSVGVHPLRKLQITESKYIEMAFQLFWARYENKPDDFSDFQQAMDIFCDDLNLEVIKDGKDALLPEIVQSINECRRDLQVVARFAGVESDLEQFREDGERAELGN